MPKDRPPIDWRLITDLPVDTLEQAVEKLQWYARRWKIEVFHHILKTGCRAEDARLRTAERRVKLIAVFCILAWRVFWTTMVGRAASEAAPRLAVTAAEITLLDRLVPDRAAVGRTLSAYVVKVARLGGYLACSRDPPPGNLVLWRGFARLADIALGAALARASPRCG